MDKKRSGLRAVVESVGGGVGRRQGLPCRPWGVTEGFQRGLTGQCVG